MTLSPTTPKTYPPLPQSAQISGRPYLWSFPPSYLMWKSPSIYRVLLARAYTGAAVLQHSSRPRPLHSPALCPSPGHTTLPTGHLAPGSSPSPRPALWGLLSAPTRFSQGTVPACLHSITGSVFGVLLGFSRWGVKAGPGPAGPLPPWFSLRDFGDPPESLPPPSHPRGLPPPKSPPPWPLPPIRRAAGVGGDSPEGWRPGGRNALTSSPRAPARRRWSAARPGLRRMFFLSPGAGSARQPPPPGRAPHSWHSRRPVPQESQSWALTTDIPYTQAYTQ